MPRTKTTRNPFGSIFKKEITWYGHKRTVHDARKRYRDASGSPKEKFKRCSSHGEAVMALANFQTEIEAELSGTGPASKPVDKTFFELADHFTKEYVRDAVFVGGVQVLGYRTNLTHIRSMIEEQKAFLGDLPLHGITYEHLFKYRVFIATKMTNRKRQPAISTVNEKLSFLRRVLNVAIQNGWLEQNPFHRGRRLILRSAETRRNRMLTFDEEVELLQACTGRRKYLRAWIIATLDTAMRRSDIYALRWKDVDLENRVIYLERDKTTSGPRSKTGVPGILPITPRLYAELTRIRASREKWAESDLVFGTFDYKKGFASICREAGIENLQFRDLRSTAATRMLLAGNSNALVRKVTRHTGDDILVDFYTNVDIHNAQLIGEKLAEFNDFQMQKAIAKGNDNKIAAWQFP